MDPFSASMGIEVAVSVLGALAKSREHLVRLLDAVRGARDKKTVWYAMCDQLGSNCRVLDPLLQNLEVEMRNGQHSQPTQERVQDVVEVLGFALVDGVRLVMECQDASTVTLFFRGEGMKEKFRKVAERIAECLRNIPLAAFQSTLEIQRDVKSIVSSLKAAR